MRIDDELSPMSTAPTDGRPVVLHTMDGSVAVWNYNGDRWMRMDSRGSLYTGLSTFFKGWARITHADTEAKADRFDRMAAACMTGILANPNRGTSWYSATEAVSCAIMLIKAIDGSAKPTDAHTGEQAT